MEYSYLTIQSATTGSYKEKGSKFLAFAYPVKSEEAIKEHLDTLKKNYFDARHHCFAWILGAEKKHFRAFDDGEPNHSAGDPILGQIRSRELTDVLVVVVRYFGGVKLGVGGLISAYKLAASEALSQAVVITKELTWILRLRYSYDATPEVMRVVKSFNVQILHQQFEEECHLEGSLSLRNKNACIEAVNLLRATGSVVDWQSN